MEIFLAFILVNVFELEFGIYLVPRLAGLDIGIWDFFFSSACSAVKDFCN